MIEQAIENLRVAMMAADHESLREITLPELSYGHTNGLIEDREAFISAIGKRDHFKSISLSDLTIREMEDVAIVRHRFQAEVFVNGILAIPDIRVLQIWQKMDGVWKLLARQAYKV